MGKKKTCPCGKISVPGLTTGVALCQEHYNALMFAAIAAPEHRAAAHILSTQYTVPRDRGVRWQRKFAHHRTT